MQHVLFYIFDFLLILICRYRKGRGLIEMSLRLRSIARHGARIDRYAVERTRVGGARLMRVEPGEARCLFYGSLSTGPRTEKGRARIGRGATAAVARL
jgi:hypothetical protein